jgi:hypothetical protein
VLGSYLRSHRCCEVTISKTLQPIELRNASFDHNSIKTFAVANHKTRPPSADLYNRQHERRLGFHNPYFDSVSTSSRGDEEYLPSLRHSPVTAIESKDTNLQKSKLSCTRYTRLAYTQGRYIIREPLPSINMSLPRPANMNVLLWHAAARGSIDTLRLAILNGANKNWRNEKFSSDHYTPLLIAARNGHVETFQVIVEDFGSSVEMETTYGLDAFMVAARWGHLDIMKYIEKNKPHSIQLDKTDKTGRTALMLAKKFKHKRVGKYLIRMINRQRQCQSRRREEMTQRRGQRGNGSQYFYNLAAAYTLYS